MAEVLDTFELKHVSTTYSEDKDGNTLTHFNCRGNAAGPVGGLALSDA